MLFPGILRDVRGLSRRSLEAMLNGHQGGKSHGCLHSMHSEPHVNQISGWADLPPELLCDVIVRLEVSESTWPARKHVVACAAVCRSWRAICKEIVRSPELCGKLTFPVSLKQPGTRDGTIQCFIKRDKSSLTYHLFLCLSSALLVENGKFLLSAKRTRRTTSTEYIISMDADNFSRSSSGYIGKLRSNFLGTKFTIYDTQATYDDTFITPPGRTGRRFNSKKLSPSIPNRSYSIAEVRYEQNMLEARGPRRVHCIMHSIPASALDAGGSVPHKPEVELLPRPLKGSFRGFSFPRCLNDPGQRCGARYSVTDASQVEPEFKPLILKNKPPRWHEQLQCWCLNFRGRVTMASVKNFQLLAAAREPTSPQATLYDCDKTILQFGKVGKDLFTMDYCYPLSAFQAFAICLSSFDTKLALE